MSILYWCWLNTTCLPDVDAEETPRPVLCDPLDAQGIAPDIWKGMRILDATNCSVTDGTLSQLMANIERWWHALFLPSRHTQQKNKNGTKNTGHTGLKNTQSTVWAEKIRTYRADQRTLAGRLCDYIWNLVTLSPGGARLVRATQRSGRGGGRIAPVPNFPFSDQIHRTHRII